MKKKILVFCAAIALSATAIIGGTLAYFTDVTEEKQNTFTVGNVNIDLTEPKWDAAAEHIFMPGKVFEKDPTITVTNDSQSAWVFMEVDMNKLTSWLRLVAIEHDQNTWGEPELIEFNYNCQECGVGHCQGHLNIANLKTVLSDKTSRDALIGRWFKGWNTDYTIMNGNEFLANLDRELTDPNGGFANLVFGFNTVKNPGDQIVLFTGIGMPETVDSQMLAVSHFNTADEQWKLTFTAHAIQSENIANQDEAYSKLFEVL